MPDDRAALPKADWYRDPGQRHELRYWDGAEWTQHVFDRGVGSVDPLTAAPQAAAKAKVSGGQQTRPEQYRDWPPGVQRFFAKLHNETPNSFLQVIRGVGFLPGDIAALTADDETPNAQQWLATHASASTRSSSRTRGITVRQADGTQFEFAVVEIHLGDVNTVGDLTRFPVLTLAVPLTESSAQFFLGIGASGVQNAMVKWESGGFFAFPIETLKPPFAEVRV